MKKYLLLPGFVKSWTDGQTHFVSAGELARLYNVPMRACHIYDRDRPETTRGIDMAKYIKLFPRSDGNYCLSPSNGGVNHVS